MMNFSMKLIETAKEFCSKGLFGEINLKDMGKHTVEEIRKLDPSAEIIKVLPNGKSVQLTPFGIDVVKDKLKINKNYTVK